jgi:hypothetical protein
MDDLDAILSDKERSRLHKQVSAHKVEVEAAYERMMAAEFDRVEAKHKSTPPPTDDIAERLQRDIDVRTGAVDANDTSEGWGLEAS